MALLVALTFALAAVPSGAMRNNVNIATTESDVADANVALDSNMTAGATGPCEDECDTSESNDNDIYIHTYCSDVNTKTRKGIADCSGCMFWNPCRKHCLSTCNDEFTKKSEYCVISGQKLKLKNTAKV